MKLIVGLGNPGKEYANTRHNFGWLVIDALSQKLGAGEWQADRSFESDLAEYRSQLGDRWLLAKPTTFMNNSGRAVATLARFYKVAPEDILVIHDELDLSFGTLRLRLGGSAAGHHGIESITYHLGNDSFWRLRCGITSSTDKRPLETSDFVLGQFSAEEQVALPSIIDAAATLVNSSLTSGTLKEETIVIP
jgi:PTH1 family peptidyl-tRNA hydrolase